MTAPRFVEDLNQALHQVLAGGDDTYLLGQDIADPYGGAFKATRGLSSRFPQRVLSTPISEAAMVGAAGGLALAGNKVIVEVMFSDFVTLAFDPIVNYLSKATTMYGSTQSVRVVVRCPTGGGRGYGPTHSQSLQKHFMGVPGLAVYEATPFHRNLSVLLGMLGEGRPCLYFEDKTLYGERVYEHGVVSPTFGYELVDGHDGLARVRCVDTPAPDVVVIATGGMARRAVRAAERAMLEHEVVAEVVVPVRLYPVPTEALLACIGATGRVVVAEESTAGASWSAAVAEQIHAARWGRLRRPVRSVTSADSVIPAAPHLERATLAQESDILAAILEP
ncbi:transketolase C-terminal domain-containing protein [Verrucosispora sp. WMMD573]|uniref:transketolase C-terminal domain-containing protein n=1 Tax=Verrucosispora sp. WMMD573 TaxID=3015149 RepID=UPI00248A9B2D|nr:transketolase C-terminal domain-containing protein [Verrucosispora sp. WMMD573]WBB53727.1 alpha-ketoacid dehydrogenase subunit beta [Verrucosispora sp. WMMD573]